MKTPLAAGVDLRKSNIDFNNKGSFKEKRSAEARALNYGGYYSKVKLRGSFN